MSKQASILFVISSQVIYAYKFQRVNYSHEMINIVFIYIYNFIFYFVYMICFHIITQEFFEFFCFFFCFIKENFCTFNSYVSYLVFKSAKNYISRIYCHCFGYSFCISYPFCIVFCSLFVYKIIFDCFLNCTVLCECLFTQKSLRSNREFHCVLMVPLGIPYLFGEENQRCPSRWNCDPTTECRNPLPKTVLVVCAAAPADRLSKPEKIEGEARRKKVGDEPAHVIAKLFLGFFHAVFLARLSVAQESNCGLSLQGGAA